MSELIALLNEREVGTVRQDHGPACGAASDRLNRFG